VVAVISALGEYRSAILPPARGELARWRAVAGAIPDAALRRAALSALDEKAANVEATAVFAILAPKRQRGAALRAMAAFQIAVDYLDVLGEAEVPEPLANGMQLHRALEDALSPGAEAADWYRLHPCRDDGGYLGALVDECRHAAGAMPSWPAARGAARRAAMRCGKGQSHTHAAAHVGVAELRSWALEQKCPDGYLWWEVAAGASSSVAVHALIAAAADPRTTVERAGLIDAAYFPPIGAITVLLDDLVDREEDRAAGEHNYLAYYPNGAFAAERLALICARSRTAAGGLPSGRRHVAILAGVAGFYLSQEAGRTGCAVPIRSRILKSLGSPVRPVLAAMRLQRWRSARPGIEAAEHKRP
jgi:tetraprenyl-beta-curcumene synthase